MSAASRAMKKNQIMSDKHRDCCTTTLQDAMDLSASKTVRRIGEKDAKLACEEQHQGRIAL